METVSMQQELEREQPGGFSASMHILDRIWNGVAAFFQLTEKEQKDAGIHLGNQPYE